MLLTGNRSNLSYGNGGMDDVGLRVQWSHFQVKKTCNGNSIEVTQVIDFFLLPAP